LPHRKFTTMLLPKKFRDRISAKGLKKGTNSRGIYLWSSLAVAEWFKDFSEDYSDKMKMDIWAVDVTGLNLTPDPETEGMSNWSSGGLPDNTGFIYEHEKLPETKISLL